MGIEGIGSKEPLARARVTREFEGEPQELRILRLETHGTCSLSCVNITCDTVADKRLEYTGDENVRELVAEEIRSRIAGNVQIPKSLNTKKLKQLLKKLVKANAEKDKVFRKVGDGNLLILIKNNFRNG